MAADPQAVYARVCDFVREMGLGGLRLEECLVKHLLPVGLSIQDAERVAAGCRAASAVIEDACRGKEYRELFMGNPPKETCDGTAAKK